MTKDPVVGLVCLVVASIEFFCVVFWLDFFLQLIRVCQLHNVTALNDRLDPDNIERRP